MENSETRVDQIQQYLRRMTPEARKNLLVELERMQMYGEDMPGSAVVLTELRAEFRKSGQSHDRVGNPSRYFFQPIEALFVDRSPERANAGEISRGSLSAIWEWINHSLLPSMAKEYCDKMKQVLVMDDPRQARSIAAGFQLKVVKSLESMLSSEANIERVRSGLAQYTSSRAAIDDLRKIMSALLVRDAIVALAEALPSKVEKFEGETLFRVRGLLNAFADNHPRAVPFALTIVARRLKTRWQLIRLATKAVAGNSVSAIAMTPYAASVSMVLDYLDDQRLALKHAFKSERLQIAKEVLTEISAVEGALRMRIAGLEGSDWGRRLDGLIAAVEADLEAEIKRLPPGSHHVLEAYKLHRQPQPPVTGMLKNLRGMLGLGAGR